MCEAALYWSEASQKVVRFDPSASVWAARQRLKDVLNYASNGQFLDEEHLVAEYPQLACENIPSLEVQSRAMQHTFPVFQATQLRTSGTKWFFVLRVSKYLLTCNCWNKNLWRFFFPACYSFTTVLYCTFATFDCMISRWEADWQTSHKGESIYDVFLYISSYFPSQGQLEEVHRLHPTSSAGEALQNAWPRPGPQLPWHGHRRYQWFKEWYKLLLFMYNKQNNCNTKGKSGDKARKHETHESQSSLKQDVTHSSVL